MGNRGIDGQFSGGVGIQTGSGYQWWPCTARDKEGLWALQCRQGQGTSRNKWERVEPGERLWRRPWHGPGAPTWTSAVPQPGLTREQPGGSAECRGNSVGVTGHNVQRVIQADVTWSAYVNLHTLSWQPRKMPWLFNWMKSSQCSSGYLMKM